MLLLGTGRTGVEILIWCSPIDLNGVVQLAPTMDLTHNVLSIQRFFPIPLMEAFSLPSPPPTPPTSAP